MTSSFTCITLALNMKKISNRLLTCSKKNNANYQKKNILFRKNKNDVIVDVIIICYTLFLSDTHWRLVKEYRNRRFKTKRLSKNTILYLNQLLMCITDCTVTQWFFSPNAQHFFPDLLRLEFGSTTTDRNKLTTNKQTANNADWLRRAILNVYLLSPEPSCPQPHFVTKSLRQNQRRNYCNEIVGSWSVCCGQLTRLARFSARFYRKFLRRTFKEVCY